MATQRKQRNKGDLDTCGPYKICLWAFAHISICACRVYLRWQGCRERLLCLSVFSLYLYFVLPYSLLYLPFFLSSTLVSEYSLFILHHLAILCAPLCSL